MNSRDEIVLKKIIQYSEEITETIIRQRAYTGKVL